MKTPPFPRRRALAIAASISLAAAIAACSVPPLGGAASLSTASALEGWSATTHGKDAAPNYAVVFPQDRASALRLVIDPADWQAMLDDMTALYGPRGSGGGFGGPRRERPASGALPPFEGPPPDGPASGAAFPGPRGPGGLGPTEKPMWVAATVQHEGREWTKVGVRFKGNSSLRSAWQSGTDRLPWKLDFDEFEGQYPAIKDQRFHGFKQLSLSTNFGDASYMRDALTYDLLQDAGLVAAETAFYEVILDHGDGPVSLGLYTAIEVVDDTVIKRVFGKDKGNIYEGDGPGVSLAAGTRNQIKASFQKENNVDEADWSDLEQLYDVLHAATRTSDPAAWRARLEAAFDVDAFLRWLAISAVIQHWDTYGGMSHNFYLYNNPADGRLTWISWDHNLVLGAGPGGPGGAPPQAPVASGDDPPRVIRGPGRGSVALDKGDVGDDWPLIRFLLDDPTYAAAYRQYLGETIEGPFEPGKTQARVERLAGVLAPVVAKHDQSPAFESAVQSLIQVSKDRVQAVQDFLAQP